MAAQRSGLEIDQRQKDSTNRVTIGPRELIHSLDMVTYPDEMAVINWGEVNLTFKFTGLSNDPEKMNISFRADESGGHISLENFNHPLGSTFSVEVGTLDSGQVLTVRGFIHAVTSSARTTRFVHIDFLAALMPS